MSNGQVPSDLKQIDQKTVALFEKAKNPSGFRWTGFFKVAGWTRLELAASGVTGRRSNQLNYHPKWVMKMESYEREVLRQAFIRKKFNYSVRLLMGKEPKTLKKCPEVRAERIRTALKSAGSNGERAWWSVRWPLDFRQQSSDWRY